MNVSRIACVVAAVGSVTFVGSMAASASPSISVSRGACTEPWSTCSPDARWLRRVLARTGHAHGVSANGAALVVWFARGAQRLERFVWTTPGTRIDPAYRPLYRVAGTPVFSDGTRVVWRAQGARIWVEPPPGRRAAARLVVASKTVPRR